MSTDVDHPPLGRAGRAWQVLVDHPVATVAGIAGVARLTVAIVSFLVNGSHLVGDEVQYVQLARTVADGHPAESWFPQFGQSLYDHTWAFTAPIRFLFDVFGPNRLVAQLYAATFGVATAVATTILARRVVRPGLALGAGLVVALTPSQVLWSSIVLRDALVWAVLVGLAVAFAWTFDPGRRAGLGVAGLVVLLLVLALLRQQTLLAAVWALPIAAAVAGGPRWRARMAVGLVLALAVPVVGDLGIGGWERVRSAFPSLATTRTLMADQAESSFVPVTPAGPDQPSFRGVPRARRRATGSGGGGTTTTTTVPARAGGGAAGENGGGTVVRVPSGAEYLVDESVSADVGAVPRGAVAVLLRPFPWEGGSMTLRLASVEEPFWYGLYLLALVGLWSAWRQRRWLAYPVVMAAAVLASEILVQGNVGTAFRHRAQLLGVLAVLAACGVERLLERRSRRPPVPSRVRPSRGDRWAPPDTTAPGRTPPSALPVPARHTRS